MVHTIIGDPCKAIGLNKFPSLGLSILGNLIICPLYQNNISSLFFSSIQPSPFSPSSTQACNGYPLHYIGGKSSITEEDFGYFAHK